MKKDKEIKTVAVDTELNKKSLKDMKNLFLKNGIIIGLVIMVVLLFVWNGIMMFRPRTEIGYVVEVNPLTGEQKVVENAVKEMSKFTTPEYLFLNTIKTYITSLRTVSTDDGVNRENVKFVYAFSTENAINFITKFYDENSPININKEGIKTDVVIYNCMPINSASGLKFQVDWNEIKRTKDGRFIEEQNYRADIDCKQYKATKQTSDMNPLGLYISNIYISEIKNGFIVNVNNQ